MDNIKLLSLNVPGYDEPLEAPSSIPTGGTDALNNVISWGIAIFIGVGILAALGYMMYGAILWITSGGDKQKVDKARKSIIYSIVGLIMMVSGLAIVTLIGTMLDINYFSVIGG